MENIAKVSQSLDFINSKDGKFESEISQGGSNVSGGQKQRLSIKVDLPLPVDPINAVVVPGKASKLIFLSIASSASGYLMEQKKLTLVRFR